MPLSVLIAEQIAERCYLHEALYWVALSRFPIAVPLENKVDGREYDDRMFDIKPALDLSIVSREECTRAGLPINPVWEALETQRYHLAPGDLESCLALETDEKQRKVLQGDLEKSIVFFDEVRNWDSKFETFLDFFTAKLFVALRQGDIVAIGKPVSRQVLDGLRLQVAEDKLVQYGRSSSESSPSDTQEERTDVLDWRDVNWERIPKDFWISKSIDWMCCSAAGDKGSYALILIETAQLFEAFSIPKDLPHRRVLQVGDAYVLLDEEGNAVDPQVARKGRPAFDWDPFHLEMAKRVCSEQLPKKREALIADMQAWCAGRWRHGVARSTLSEKIKPYYDAFMRSSES